METQLVYPWTRQINIKLILHSCTQCSITVVITLRGLDSKRRMGRAPTTVDQLNVEDTENYETSWCVKLLMRLQAVWDVTA